MKKNLIGAFAIAALTLASCSKSDISDSLDKGTKLNFRLNSGKTTKMVNEADTTTLNTTGTLELYYFDKNGDSCSFSGYTDNQVVLIHSASGWNPEKEVYLPAEGDVDYPISFYSTFPAQQSFDKTSKTFEYEITYGTGDSGNTDLLVAKADVANSASTSVNIDYTHALAQVIVTVQYTNPRANTYAIVSNCRVTGINSSATYNFNNNSWEKHNTHTGINYKETTTRDTTTILDRFVFIPQQTLNEFSFNWAVNSDAGDTLVIGGEEYKTTSQNLYLEAGYRYYLDIIIDGGKSLKFNVSINKDWEDKSHTPVDPH